MIKGENIPSLIEKAKIPSLEDVKYENTQEFMKIIETEEIRTLKNNCEALIANHHAINELRIENNSH